MKFRMIYLCWADYGELCDKGVAPHGILKRGDDNFFEKVIHIHIGANKTQIISLDESNVVVEFGIGSSQTSTIYRLIQLLYAPLYLLKVVLGTYKIVIKNKIHFIRGADPYWCGFTAFIVSRLAKIPFCISLHADYDKRGIISNYGVSTTVLGSVKLGKLLAQFILYNADMILPIRKSLGDWAIKNGAKAENIRLIPHGIDLDCFEYPLAIDVYECFGIEKKNKIISFIGRLSNENYVDDIFKMARFLGRMRTDFVVVLAGKGSEEARLLNMIDKDSVLQRTIKMVGFQKQEICFDLRKASTVSLCLMGGFSLIEACVAGRPVVAYDVEWHYELVKNKETGFLVKEHDIENLIKDVNYLLDNPYEADKMGENARKHAIERHDIQKTNAIKRQCYQELLKI